MQHMPDHVCVEAMWFSADSLQAWSAIFQSPCCLSFDPFVSSPLTNLQQSKEALLMNFTSAFTVKYLLTFPFLLISPLTSPPSTLNSWMAILHRVAHHSSPV